MREGVAQYPVAIDDQNHVQLTEFDCEKFQRVLQTACIRRGEVAGFKEAELYDFGLRCLAAAGSGQAEEVLDFCISISSRRDTDQRENRTFEY